MWFRRVRCDRRLRLRSSVTRSDCKPETGLIYDAVRVRLIEIGKAGKGIDPEVLAQEPTIPWSDIAGMRDHLTHRYFDTDHAIRLRHRRAGFAAARRRRPTPYGYCDRRTPRTSSSGSMRSLLGTLPQRPARPS